MRTSLLHLHGFVTPGEDAGQLHHRITRPTALLNEDGRLNASAISWVHPQAPDLACASDLLVIHALTDTALHSIIELRRKRGLRTLFELADDPSAPTPWRKRRKHPDHISLSNLYNLAAQCDGVQFSTPFLQQRFAILNTRTFVLPNCVDLPETLPEKPAAFTIGWAGTASHRDDLATIAPALEYFCRSHSDVHVALKGNPEMLRDIFAALPTAQLSIEPFGSPDSYFAFLNRLHVGIAPLAPSAFNLGRTDLKLFEYIAAGAIVLAQDAPPYQPHAQHVLLFGTPDALLAQLETCYAQRNTLTRRALDQLTYACSMRSPSTMRSTHADWYLSHTPEALTGALPLTTCAADRAYLHELSRATADTRPETHETELRSTLQQFPDYPQLRLALVSLLLRAGRTEEAETIGQPLLQTPAFHDLFLTHLLRHVTPDRASSLRKQLRSNFFRTVAEPVSSTNFTAQAEQFLMRAPFHYFALTHLARTFPENDIFQQRLSLFTPSAQR